MIWRKIAKVLAGLLFVALMVAPVCALFYISDREQAKYIRPQEAIQLPELSYGEPTAVMHMDFSETITLSGTVVSTRVIYEELELENAYAMRLLVSSGEVLQAGDLIGYWQGKEVKATKTGIIRSINLGSDPYIELWSLEDLAIECYVDDIQRKVLQRGSLKLTDQDENEYTVSRIDSIRIGGDQTRVLLTSETAELIFGKSDSLTLNTGRVYTGSLVVPSSCVFSTDGGQTYYVRLVNADGTVIGNAPVEVGETIRGMTCINGVEEGQLCDPGYKVIVEG